MAGDERPLSEVQRRACALLAAGRLHKDVAEELGISGKSLQRLTKREDARALIRRHREAIFNDLPTAEETLVQALSATRPDGHPDFANRIAAARALLSTPVATPEAEESAREVLRERIYISPDGDGGGDHPGDGGSARSHPLTRPEYPA